MQLKKILKIKLILIIIENMVTKSNWYGKNNSKEKVCKNYNLIINAPGPQNILTI